MSNSSLLNIFDAGSGLAQGKEGTTVETFALSLAAGVVLFSVQFTAFVALRNYLWAKRIYQPRCFLIPLKDRMKPPPNNIFRWLVEIISIKSEVEVLHKAGMDAYFFLRYLTMCLKMFFPLACLILPILLPLNIVSGKDTRIIAGNAYNVTGLDTLAWSNVPPEHTSRYWAHLLLAICVIGWVCFIFHQELAHYVVRRQEYLSSPSHRLKASSTTVLITDIPPELCTTEHLTELYDDLPGGIRRLWINKNHQAIVNKHELRKHYEDLLENSETDLLRKITKVYRKKSQKSGGGDDEMVITPSNIDLNLIESTLRPQVQFEPGKSASPTAPEVVERDLQYDIQTHAAWTHYIEPRRRKKMWIPKASHPTASKIPLVGRFFSDRVDTIFFCRRELARLNAELDLDIENADTCPSNGSAFIQFNTQKAAHLACQAAADTAPRSMLQRTVEMSPADVNWPSLNYSWTNRAIRLLVFLFLFLIVIVVFSVLSFFTGILSRVSRLAGSTSWLHWISTLPSWLLSFIQGTLPPVIQVIVLSGPTPIVLRAMTNTTRGAISGSQGERSLQLWYFVFLLLELFVIPTISAGLTSVVQQLIQSPTSVPEILATNLPSAANYYFSFLVVQALSISASSIFQTVRMLNYYVFGGYNTPDQLFTKLTFTHLTRIGSNIPWYTTFAVIGLVYSVIAPLILPFVIITFVLFWVVIKNNLLFVVRTGNVDSGGVWFPHAINQTFTGLYFMEACLLGLFFLVRDVNDNVACKAQGTIMAVCVALTILYQAWLSHNFTGLYKYAPLRLEGIAAQKESEWEMQRLTAPEQDADLSEKTLPGEDEARTPNHHKITSFAAPNEERVPIQDHSDRKSPDDTNITEGIKKRRSSIRSTVIDRSKYMQVQKEHDKRRASHVLARLNRPLDERRLAALESKLAATETKIGNVFLPRKKDIEARMMDDPISKIIMQHNDELEDLTTEERDLLVSVAFTHPVLRETKPAVWIPQDDLNVSEDEIRRTRELGGTHLVIDNRGAFFDRQLKVQIDRAPPDMSEFALVMREL